MKEKSIGMQICDDLEKIFGKAETIVVPINKLVRIDAESFKAKYLKGLKNTEGSKLQLP